MMDSDKMKSYFQISKVSSKFKGCYTSNNLPESIESHYFYFINTSNTKESEKKNGYGHWTVLFGAPISTPPQPLTSEATPKDTYAIFFDPYGRICENYDLIKKTLKSHSYILYNNYPIQSIFSDLCGVHCSLVSVFWSYDYSFESILLSLYDFSSDHEMTNDMRALKLFKCLTPSNLSSRDV